MTDEFDRDNEERFGGEAEEAVSNPADSPEPARVDTGAMTAVVSVQFRNRGKSYFFAPNGLAPRAGVAVVVETSKGLELGTCTEGVHSIPESSVVPPLRPVVRIATAEDIHVGEMNRAREKTAFSICEDKIRAHKLDMKLVDVEYSFEGGKILFFFTSDGRVDFRELVKDLAGVFHTRIELRQIGVRDGAKMLGGLGICGRPFCCTTFLEEFQPVSIRMAKTQSLSLNPTKISGTCGRLMCCLKYEQDAYESLLRSMPKVDAQVDTPKGKGSVAEVNLLRRTVKVRLADAAETTLQSYPVDCLGYTLNGEYIEPKAVEAPSPAPPVPDLSRLFPEPEAAEIGEPAKFRSERRKGNKPPKNRPKPYEASGEAEAREKPLRSAENREKPPRPEGERKKDFRPKNGKPKPNAAAAGENAPRPGKDARPPKEFHGSKDFKPPREPRPPRGDNPQSGEFAAGRPEKKSGGYYNRQKKYYHRDKRKPEEHE